MSFLVCWQHFLISDFMKEISEDDIASCDFGRLKKGVVPSQHLPGDPEITSEDAKFALFIIENNENIENSEEKDEKSAEISKNLKDNLVQQESDKTQNNETEEILEISPSINENLDQIKVLRALLSLLAVSNCPFQFSDIS